MALDVAKSQKQADIIKTIAILINEFDFDYCDELSMEMFTQVRRQESLAVLNPGYPQSRNDLLRKQAKALSLLSQYARFIGEIKELRKKVEEDQKVRGDISKMFI